jgi:hypothetical protein
MAASFTSTTYSPDALVAGEEQLLTRKITLVSGQNLVRGAVLGKITSGGKYTLSASAAVDGSQTPDAVLAEDTNATGGDVVTVAYFAGRFNEGKVVLGVGHTADSIREGLRSKDIHLVNALNP